ncbi:MAG: 2-oxoglutarate dehydrogenase complex dihydrolipoyllysine-residue succinyltransferase [Trueperaceae bacterium]|nr:MAG: 2-oxoglutarate dehydrogenase complex dihydrolipoyllysine-residue succinyltransferase [Trueperaceae bacterium]
MSVDVTVPSVGESISEVFIGTWLKGEGDAVVKDEALVELETDKATLEVSAPVDGVLTGIRKQAGDSANVGDVIASVEPGASADAAPKGGGDGDAAKDTGVAKDVDTAEASDAPTSEPPKDAASDGPAAGDDVKVMPAAQRLLDEHGLKASDVKATGPGGRLLKDDVQKHVEAAKAAPSAPAGAPTAVAADGRTEEAVPMSTLRRRIAERLVQAQQTAALLTTFNEIDMSAVMALRAEYKESFEKRHGVRLGFMSFFVKATIDALKSTPQLNAEIRGTDIVYKDYYDIGVAVSTKRGLVVPVLRDAERLSFAEVEKSIGDFGQRAQAGKLTPDELQGGTFTITNGGVFGSLMSTPIVNPPQSGVLGMHTIQERPIALKGQVVIRPMMYVALTYDHRIVDGREAVTFLKRIKEAVENPTRMLIEV